jgi:hypothetical protein
MQALGAEASQTQALQAQALQAHALQRQLIQERFPGVTLGNIKSSISSVPSLAATFISEPIFMNISNVAFDFMQGIFSREVGTVMAKAIVASVGAGGAMAAGPAIAIATSSLAVAYVLYRKLNQNYAMYFELIDAINAYTILLFRIQHNLDMVARARSYYGFSSIDNSEDIQVIMTEIIIYFKSLISKDEASELQQAFLRKRSTVTKPGFFSRLKYMWKNKGNLFKDKSQWLAGFNVLVMKLSMVFSLYMNEFQLSLQIHQSASSMICNQLYAASMANSEAFQCMSFVMIYQPFIMFREGLLACMMSGSSNGCARLISLGEKTFLQKHFFTEVQVNFQQFNDKFSEALGKINNTINALETAISENGGNSSYGSKLTPRLDASEITRTCSISIYTKSFVSYMRQVYTAMGTYLMSVNYNPSGNNINTFIILCNHFFRLISKCSQNNHAFKDLNPTEEQNDIFKELGNFNSEFEQQRIDLLEQVKTQGDKAKAKVIEMIMPLVDDRLKENIAVIDIGELISNSSSKSKSKSSNSHAAAGASPDDFGAVAVVPAASDASYASDAVAIPALTPAAAAATAAAAGPALTPAAAAAPLSNSVDVVAQQLSYVIEQMFPQTEESSNVECLKRNAFYSLICKQANITAELFIRGADELLAILLKFVDIWIQTILHHLITLKNALISQNPNKNYDTIQKLINILEIFYQIYSFFMSDNNLGRKQYKSERSLFFSHLFNSASQVFATPTALLMPFSIETLEREENAALEKQHKSMVRVESGSDQEPLVPDRGVKLVNRFKTSDLTNIARILTGNDIGNLIGSIKWLASIANMTINYMNICILNPVKDATNVMHKVINSAFFNIQTEKHSDSYPILCPLLNQLRDSAFSNQHLDYGDFSNDIPELKTQIKTMIAKEVTDSKALRSKKGGGRTRRLKRLNRFGKRTHGNHKIYSQNKTLRHRKLRKVRASFASTSRAGKHAHSTRQRSSGF